MRQVRAPPKVTPPKPPARLFEPRDDAVPMRLEKKLDEAKPYNFEDDVKFQMQQLENEMKLMLEKGEPPAQSLGDRRVDPRSSYSSQHGAPEPFPERINPSDWKVKGFPSEYAYMKATGQLDMPSSKPIPQAKPQFNESLNPARDSGYGLPNKQQSAPAFPEQINPKDWKAKGFPSEYAYMKATGQLDAPSSKPIPPMFDTNPANRGSNASFDPRNDPRNDSRNDPRYDPRYDPRVDPRGPSQMNEPPAPRPNERNAYEKEIVSPARRKGGALQNLYVEEDEIRRKFASQHSYSDQLQQQAAQQRQAREAEQQAHRGVGGPRGGDPREANTGMRLPSERGPVNGAGRPLQPDPYVPPAGPAARGRNEPPTGYRGGPETERYDPAALTLGADRTRAPGADPFHRSAPPGGLRQENPYEAKQTSPMDRRQGGAPAAREEVSTGLLLGLDKNSEKALKRAKQEEYKRQLDQMQQPKAQVPSPSVYAAPPAADGKSYLPTGARPAPERYDPRIPPAAVQPASSAYPPAAHRDTRPPPEYFSAATEGLRDPYEPPMAARNNIPPEHMNYSSGREPQGQAGRYASSEYGGDGPGAYGGYPGPGAAGGRGGPSPMRQMPPGRQEDPYRQQGPPQNAPGDYSQGRQAAPANFGASAVPAESQEKMKKRLEQEAYRRELEAQMEIKKAQKSQMKKEEAQIDQKFLQQIVAAEASNPQRGKKGPAQQGDWQAPPAASQQPASQQPAFQQPPAAYGNAPPRVVPAGTGARGNSNQQVDDRAAEIEFLKAQLARLNQQDDSAPSGYGRQDLFEREEERSFQRDGRDPRDFRDPRDDDRSDFDPRQAAPGGPYGGGGVNGRDPQGPYGGRQLDINTEYGVEPGSGSATSPYKSPNQARTRMMKDIYGGDLITHSKPDPQQGGNWKAVGGMNDRKREIIAEQKAALDKQVEDDRVRKEKQKKDEDEKDRLKEERDRADRERIADAERQEKRKKDQFNEDSARDLAELQHRKEQEALARKGRGGGGAVKPAPQVHEEDSRFSNGNAPQNRGEPARGQDRGPERDQERGDDQSQGRGRGAQSDYPPSGAKGRADYPHIESPVRDIIQLQREKQLEMMMASRQSADYASDRGGGGAGRAGGISLYENPTPDEMERFMQQHRASERHDGGYGGGGGSYPPQQRGYEPSPYASYDRPPPGQQDYSQGRGSQQYPYPPQNRDYPPYHQQAQQHSPHRQPPPFYPARGNFYAPDNDISLVAESRLLPANPFSSSDMLSSLVPLGASAHANANANAQKQSKAHGRSEMEKSMSSDSAMIYMGQRTPLLEPGATRPNLQEQAVAGMPSRKIHSSGRPSSGTTTAKLSDVIEEANRVIEQEKRELHKGSAGESNHRPSDRIAPKQDYSTEPTLLGENDGISTVYRQDSRTRYDNYGQDADEVPKNRIFLNQKPRYQDEPAAPEAENEVAGYDDNLARSIQLLASAEKAPRLDTKVAADMSTQTSALNLLQLAAVTAATTEPAPLSVRKSPRKNKDASSESDQQSAEGNKHKKHSPRKSPRSPRVEEVLATEIDTEPVPIDGTFYTYGISPRADGSDTPDSYMSSMKYDPPFSPALAPQIAPTVVEGEAGEEGDQEAEAASQRKNALNASASIVKPVDHRSPRQRALDNKQAREAVLATGAELPARKHLPVEEDFAELTSPDVPRLPRKNILDANEALLQAPTDNRYRSPRQRALDRESSKKSDFSPRPADADELTQENLAKQAAETGRSSHEDDALPEPSPGPSESGFLPFVMNGSVDDTRFNEWPAEEHAVEVNNGSVAAAEEEEQYQDDFPPDEYAQDPEHVKVGTIDNADEAAVEQENEYASKVTADPQVFQDEAPEDTMAWDNYQAEEPPPEVTNSATDANPEVEQDYDQGYEQGYIQQTEPTYEEPAVAEEYGVEYEQEYAQEADATHEPLVVDPAEELVEGGTDAEPTPTGYPEYGNEDEYSYVVESNMPYEYYDDDEEEAAIVPVENSQDAKDTSAVEKDSSVEAVEASGAEAVVAAEIEAHDAIDTAEAADAVNLAESNESHVPVSARGRVQEDFPADFLPEVVAMSSTSRPASGRPRTGNVRASRDESDAAPGVASRPTTGRTQSSKEAELLDEPRPSSSRPATGRPRTAAALEEDVTVMAPVEPVPPSRPSSSRPRTGEPLLSSRVPESVASRPATSSRPRTGALQGTRDPEPPSHGDLDAAPVVSRPPTSGRPRSSASLSSRVPDTLDSSVELPAPTSSRPGTSGRPRTGVTPLSSRVPDVLDQAISESTDKPLLSRPASSARPRSGAPLFSREPDALEQAINAPSASRPSTSGRLRAEAAPVSARAPDALEQAISDVASKTPSASRPPTSGRPRTGAGANRAHSPEIDALDQALAWSAPTTH